MKKFMILAAAAAMTLGAMADYTVSNVFFSPAPGDEKWSQGELQNYSAYVIQFKGGDDAAWLWVKDNKPETVISRALAQYVNVNGEKSGGTDAHGYFFYGDQGDGRTSVDPTTLDIPFSEAYAVVYYSGGVFELIGAEPEMTVDGMSRTDYIFNSRVIGNGWTNAIPEPTSGLLMLLGMAGLMLKRKRA